MRLVSNQHRPHHMSQFALERLRRDPTVLPMSGAQPDDLTLGHPDSIGEHCEEYLSLFRQFLTGKAAAARAPVPDDLTLRADNLKASAYFLDAAIAGFACNCRGDRHQFLELKPSAKRNVRMPA